MVIRITKISKKNGPILKLQITQNTKKNIINTELKIAVDLFDLEFRISVFILSPLFGLCAAQRSATDQFLLLGSWIVGAN